MAENIAEKLAEKQREISIAEFFEKNRHILGFDSSTRSLITSVKEAVDNALDACEESGVLPDILIEIHKVDKDNYRVVVEDNGPGIVKEQIPRVFGKLLYGSRFHALKQSRGQQGIGISAVVLYAQLTSGRPTAVYSKTGKNKEAHYYELVINTKTNEPEILMEKIVPWDRPHGTRIEVEMEGTYVRARKQSIYGYAKSTAIVNPHARLTLIEPTGDTQVFERVTEVLPVEPCEILPHPEGIELGTLIKMLRYTERRRLTSFLTNEFARIGHKTAKEICAKAGVDPDVNPSDLSRDQAKRLLEAFKTVKIIAPSTECLSPITEELIRKGLEKEYDVDFIATTTRDASVHTGNPFIVEAGIAYGGSLPKEEKTDLLRFANRVPLLYQQGGCASTHAVEKINWRNYELLQPGGSGIPQGPVVILTHVASTNVPFTSESKEAIADIPEIVDEIELAVRDVARGLKNYLAKQKVLAKRKEKEEIIERVLPKLAEKVSEVTGGPQPDIQPIVAKIMGNVLVQKTAEQNDNTSIVTIRIKNFSESQKEFKLHQVSAVEIEDPTPKPRVSSFDGQFDNIWKVSIKPNAEKKVRYTVKSEQSPGANPLVEGILAEMVTGADALPKKRVSE
ncbi:MAG: DNA topoisomerase VI subunit B [Halobacteriota archaeon]|jgi:DNA topoisomerase-6 subunit B